MRICAADSIPMVMKKAAVQVALVAALVIGTAPAAPALAAPGDPMAPAVIPTGSWRLVVTPDDAAVSAGRDPFEEFVLIESTSDITAQEMCRLGFYPAKGKAGTNVAGQTTFTVTLKSTWQGSVTWSGTFESSTVVSGTLAWVRPDGVTYNYTFTGTTFTPPVDVES
jgi:hypothetical protein